MKYLIFILFISFSLIAQDKKAKIKLKNHVVSLNVDTNIFIQKRLKKYIDPSKVTTIKKLRSLNQLQINSWLLPLSRDLSLGEAQKLISFQGAKLNSYQIIIGDIFEFYSIHSLPSAYVMRQYLVSIDKKTGKYIDGVRIQGQISGDELGDSIIVDKGLVLQMETESYFIQDTVFINHRMKFLNPPSSSDNKDVKKEDIKEKYLLQPDGKFKKLQ